MSHRSIVFTAAGHDSVHCGALAPIVFVVNGDAHMREALHILLSSEGFNAISFASAAEYRAADKLDVPSCLILDVDLPDMSGLDLQHQLAHADPPIVFVTHRFDVRSCVRAVKAGAVDFLTSPFRDSELLQAVNAAIARYRDTRSHRAELLRLQRRFALLTPREREVLSFVVSGLLNKQSACELGISEVTLQVHRGRIMQKMAARSLADLVRMAARLQVPLVCPHTLNRQQVPTYRVQDSVIASSVRVSSTRN